MNQPTPRAISRLLALLLSYLHMTREASWPTSVTVDSNLAHGVLSAAVILEVIDHTQRERLSRLIYNAAGNRNRELSLRQLPYCRKFSIEHRRASA